MVMRIIRTVIAVVAVPAGILFALFAAFVLLTPIPGFLLAGWLLISAAGRRLEGNGLAVAIAERR